MKQRPSFCCSATLSAITLVTIAHAQVDAPAPSPSHADAVPEGLNASEWSSIRAAYDANRHAVRSVEGGYRAWNEAQQWATLFDGRGFTTTPRRGAWTWGLDLVRYGWGEEQQTLATPRTVSSEGERVAYVWDERLTEWYVNERRGLEHGYTVHARHAGATGRLAFALAVRGGLEPVVSEGGRDVRFVDADGKVALTYTGLAAFDADGRALASGFERRDDNLGLWVDERDARYPITIDPLAQQAYLKASNTGADDAFGGSVAVSGDTVVVGASLEDSNATGVNGDGSDDSAINAGAAYVFVRSGTTWSQQAYLKAPSSEPFDYFGGSVSISGDTVVVGASGDDTNDVDGEGSESGALNLGAAYVFVRSGTTWTQQAYLKASNAGNGDGFGFRVSISGDTLVVGTGGEDSSATGVDGDGSDNGAVDSGAAYVFVRSGTTWSQQAYLKASNTGAGDNFGGAVSVSGDTLVVGAYREDSNATGVDGDGSNDSASLSGAAYVFTRSGTTWSQEAYLKASNAEAVDLFGYSVSVSGDTVVVGARNEASKATGVNGDQSDNSEIASGAAYVFVRDGTTWSQQAYLKASNTGQDDIFGKSLSLSGNMLVVAAPWEDSNATGVGGDQGNNSKLDSGALYVFLRSGATWSQAAYVKASNGDVQDNLGESVAVSGDTFVAGTIFEDSDATGVGGDQSDNSTSNSGAAYVFELVLPFPAFCDASDGSLASCPCANPGAASSGCDNAQATGGVSLAVLAQTSSPNGATLSGTGFSTMGAPTALVIRSNSLDPASPVVFGDGLRCIATSSLVRLAATTASGGVSAHTLVHGVGAGPGTFYYQLWYRNIPSGYCTPAGFNLSSGRTLVW